MYTLLFIVNILTQHTGKIMNITPYTLRAGLLSQAEKILTHKYHQEYERIRYLCDRDIVDPKTTTWPEPPTLSLIHI